MLHQVTYEQMKVSKQGDSFVKREQQDPNFMAIILGQKFTNTDGDCVFPSWLGSSIIVLCEWLLSKELAQRNEKEVGGRLG